MTERALGARPLGLDWSLWGWWWVVAMIAAGEYLLQYNLHGAKDITWWGPVVSQFLLATLWALATPHVFGLTRHFGERPQRSGRRILLALVGLAVATGFSTCRAWLHDFEHTPETRPCSDGWVNVLKYLQVDLTIFAAVFAIGLARRYLRQREAEQARTAAIEVQLAQARLQALQMQLNPHFLFNALNTISALVGRDAAGTRIVVARLSELLRRTLDTVQRPEVQLDDELRFIAAYLEIMAFRFPDRLRTEISVEQGLGDAIVPAFIIQPLVENAFEHGIAKIRGSGVVELGVFRRGDQLCITVRDNGPGPKSAHVHDGIGLSNTAARLAQLYPGHSALRLESVGVGTLATIELPYRSAADEDR